MSEIHKGSQETKDFIASWITPDFFFSKNDKWDRFGMLGVFGDYVLSCVGGDILDIGVGESSIYLSYLARKYNRQSHHCDVAASKIINPLTIAGYITPEAHFGLDNYREYTFDNHHFYAMTSDAMFEKLKDRKAWLALSFIDGDHIYEQARKDFLNCVNHTVENGYIMLHDTYPPGEDWLHETRCGTVYKLRQEIEINPRFDCLTLTRGAAMGVGLTIVRVKPAKLAYYNE